MWAVRVPPNRFRDPPLVLGSRLLNSPGHSALSPNLPQTFSRKVGSLTPCCCTLLELIFRLLARACFTSGLFQLSTIPQPRRCDESKATVCLRAPEGQSNPGGRGGSGAVFGTELGARRWKYPLGRWKHPLGSLRG